MSKEDKYPNHPKGDRPPDPFAGYSEHLPDKQPNKEPPE